MGAWRELWLLVWGSITWIHPTFCDQIYLLQMQVWLKSSNWARLDMAIPRLSRAPVWRWHHQHGWHPCGYQPALALHATRVAGNYTHAMLSHATIFFGWKGPFNETKWDQWTYIDFLPITINSGKNKLIENMFVILVGHVLEWVGASRAGLTPWLTLNHGCLYPQTNECSASGTSQGVVPIWCDINVWNEIIQETSTILPNTKLVVMMICWIYTL